MAMATALPTTRLSRDEWAHQGLLAVAIALIGLLIAAGFGLTHQANTAPGADREVRPLAEGDHLVAVAADTGGTHGLTPAGHDTAPPPADPPVAPASSVDGSAPATRPGAGSSQTSGGTVAGTGTVSAADGPAGYLDSDAAVAAKVAVGPAAPAFDHALVELSARQRVTDQHTRVEQARRQNGKLEQVRRVAAQAAAAEEIRTEQTRLVDEQNRAAADEALLQAQLAALGAGRLSDGAIRLPDGTLVRPSADGRWPASVLATLGRLGRTGPTGRTVTPLAKGTYRLGARWGAVGSWASYHTGVDFGAPIGTPVRAAADGTVVIPVAGEWAGTHVIVAHSDGSTLYAHLLASTVRPGQRVKAGDIIGFVGMTGRTFGPHLHFEYYPRGASLQTPYAASDPLLWLASRGVTP